MSSPDVEGREKKTWLVSICRWSLESRWRRGSCPSNSAISATKRYGFPFDFSKAAAPLGAFPLQACLVGVRLIRPQGVHNLFGDAFYSPWPPGEAECQTVSQEGWRLHVPDQHRNQPLPGIVPGGFQGVTPFVSQVPVFCVASVEQEDDRARLAELCLASVRTISRRSGISPSRVKRLKCAAAREPGPALRLMPCWHSSGRGIPSRCVSGLHSTSAGPYR